MTSELGERTNPDGSLLGKTNRNLFLKKKTDSEREKVEVVALVLAVQFDSRTRSRPDGKKTSVGP